MQGLYQRGAILTGNSSTNRAIFSLGGASEAPILKTFSFEPLFLPLVEIMEETV